ncbi:MAG TPA: ATP-binding protein [Rhodocyclaceae bacterium]|nr:ATP-binding protein [Rhodocyclaceae bacterium]
MRTRLANSDSFHLSVRLALHIFGAYALVALLLALGTWLLVAQDRIYERRNQEAELGSLSRALDEHVTRTFGEVDSALQSLAGILGGGRFVVSGIDTATVERLRETATEWSSATPQAAILGAITNYGKPIVTVSQRDLPYDVVPLPIAVLPWLMNPQAPTRISLPLKLGSAVNPSWYIPIEHGAVTSNGELIGIVHALIGVKYFEAFYDDVHSTSQDEITLLTSDGHVLMHYPEQDRLMGSSLSQTPDFPYAGKQRTQFYSGLIDTDDLPAITAFRHVVGYPLIVAVSRPESAALENFRAMRDRLLAGALLTIALLGCLASFTYYDARRRELARLELARMNTSLEARVGRRTAELEQSNRELIAFSYSISHDLRAPLRAINGFAHAVREDYGDKLDEHGREYLDRIYRASVRMGELIDELLSLANVSRQPLSIQRVDLSAIAQEIMEELKLAEPNRAVQFEVQQGMRTEGDEALLRNALSNLLHNAWKFTRARRPAVITVTATDEAEHERFVVADNGVGFDMSHAKRLFQPFQQLHTNQGFSGTGIGLASVRRIIERHGGRIWAESMPEHGARFIIELPHRAAVMRRRRSANMPDGSAGSRSDDRP